MFSFSAPPIGFDLRLLETIWLEPEQVEQAQEAFLGNPLLNHSALDEASQWQLYLNRLALAGFKQWLQKRLSTYSVDWTQCINQVDAVYHLKVGEFKLNLIVKEHVLDEVVEISRAAIAQSDHAAHFYVLLEVAEEAQQVILRGFLRHDQLIQECDRIGHALQYVLQNECYSIPLSTFDPEPNHLLYYCEFLEPSAIPLSLILTEHSATSEVTSEVRSEAISTSSLQEIPAQLGQWIQGLFTEGWLALEDLVIPHTRLAFNTRNQGSSVKRGKLIDLGMELQGQKVALLVNVTETDEEKLAVLVQLHPAGGKEYLPPQITLTLHSQTGEILQEVRAREMDDYIQLKSFKGLPGIAFRVGVNLDEMHLYENFEL
jgi:Protein of unknown function (DUF1822)